MNTVSSVLIVDDNPHDVRLTKKMLEKSGRFECVYAVSDGVEALALFQGYQASRTQFQDAFPPLLILLDINMPFMDGFEFLNAYTSLDPEMRGQGSLVVMLTSSSHGRDRQRALDHPAVMDYVVKPINRRRANELAEKILQSTAAI